MSATITLAKQESTGIIKHINAVDKQEQLLYHCLGCGREMIVIKSEARKRDWHFRHSVESDCSGGRDTALHDFAVQIIMENTDISISKKLQIAYNEPRKEITFFGKRSDVTVKYENEDIHFEVFVTHDLDIEKSDIYKANKIKCVRIDLSEPDLLTASPEKIKDVVLNQHENKSIIYWQDEEMKSYESKESDFNWKHLLIIVGAFIGLRFLYNRFFKPKRRNLR